MNQYRVNLDIYNGPLDLLLYLIRRDEVDIHDIPIVRIMEQYLQYVEVLKRLDPNLVGGFLVMAATLMEIKTLMLLPGPSPEEAGEEGLEIDPRAELVRQLLEYKAFKDAAGDLREAAAARALKFPRRPAQADDGEDRLDLDDAQVWDLLDAFSRLMAAIGADAPTHEVVYDDTPIELHQADILDRLQRDGPMGFRKVFEGCTDRTQILGLFLALLELVRLRRILAAQRTNFGEIHLRLNPDPPAEQEAATDDQGDRRAGSPADAKPDVGKYVPEGPRPQGEGHDAGRATPEAEP
ncbi:MAG TPA: segregation/condensation protein A [Phycisphaerae bacterium]|nr:segregation/condensation protein A [Phycisphaerae bacterium]